MNSCIYEGLIRHRRNAPKVHEFDFRSFMLLLDLDELDQVFADRWFWSTSKFSLASFRESQHLTANLSDGSIQNRVRAVLKKHGVEIPIGPIRLLTQLSYLGFTMNPVSFFFCYDPGGSRVEAIIAEVNNTPWGEQHVYLLPGQTSTNRNGFQRNITADRIEKVFHVSPFMSLDMSYRMAFSIPGSQLGVKIENLLDEPINGVKKILDVTMLMKRKPLTARNLNWLLIKYPLLSFKIFAGIYWQAFRLYLKRIPFFSHPGKPGDQKLERGTNQNLNVESKTPVPANPLLNQLPEPASAPTSPPKPETALINQ